MTSKKRIELGYSDFKEFIIADKVFDLFNVAYARYIINGISKSKLYTGQKNLLTK